MLTYRKHVETTAGKCKKGLSVLKAMAAKGIKQRHLFQLYQSVVLSATDYGLGLTTTAQTNLLKLDRVQNEAMPVILGTSKDYKFHARPFSKSWGSCYTIANQTESGAGQSILHCWQKSTQPTSWSRERHRGMHTGTGKVLVGSSRGLNTASMPADRVQANQGVGKVPKPIPASLWDTPVRKLGQTLSRRPAGKTESEIKLIIQETANCKTS